jgi:hypothetical protein
MLAGAEFIGNERRCQAGVLTRSLSGKVGGFAVRYASRPGKSRKSWVNSSFDF